MANPHDDVYSVPGGSGVFAGRRAPRTGSLASTQARDTAALAGDVSTPQQGGGVVPLSTGKYRYEQQYLFQTAPAEKEPNRVAAYVGHVVGDGSFNRAQWGPSSASVDSDWVWEVTHGDWIDANGVRYGTTPALSAALNDVAGAIYNVDATAIVQQAFNADRWLAMKWDVSPATTRNVASKLSTYPPRIEVTYTDATTETLACRITALSNTSTSTKSFDDNPVLNLNPAVLVEFNRPSKAVQSATLSFRIDTRSGSNTTMRAWLLDPRVNTSPVVEGIAASAALDADVVTHPSVLAAHRYVDGTGVSDFVYDGVIGSIRNLDGMGNFDPAIFGEGPTDLTKYPHTLITAPTANSTGHRWSEFPSLTEVPETPYPPDDSEPFASVTVVPSTYSGQGFVPLAPGMGALKFHMRPGLDQDFQPIHDGSRVGERGTGMTSRMYFDEPNFGTVDDIYVRSYFRFATPDGAPYVDSIADRYNVNQTQSTGGTPQEIGWLDKAGKNFMVPDHHCYPKGGFSGSSGGPYGWQARGRWYVVDEQDGGPMEGGMGWGFHGFDIQNNPEGNYARNYNYGASAEIQNCGYGGMHIFYAHRWYCMEVRHKLNTVLPYYPGFIDDGKIQFWIDGRLAITKNNIVMRQLPVWRGNNTAVHSTSLGANQWAAIVASGMAAGAGYVGVCVRHNRNHGTEPTVINGTPVTGVTSTTQCYAAVLSRYSATQAVIGLVRRVSDNPSWWHLAQTDPIPWADGDELRLEAAGGRPTVLTVKKNGGALTLKWYTGKTSLPKPSGATDDPNAFQNPGSAALQTATSYTDSTDFTGTSAHPLNTLDTNPYVGLFTMNNDATNGLRIDSWSASDGLTNLSDTFAYADADLTVANPAFKYCDPTGSVVCPPIVRSGSVIADPQHRLDENNNMLSCRSIGARNLLLNWFHGGQTTNAENRYQFITGVVAATSYIGPMKGVSEYPSGVDAPQAIPTPGNITTFSTALSLSSQPTNQWIDTGIVPGQSWAIRSMMPLVDAATTDQLGGASESVGNATALADDTLVNSNGCAWFPSRNQLFFAMGGHGGWPGNEVYCVDLPSRSWVRLDDPSDMTYQPAGATDNWETVDGRPKSAHTYGGLVAVESQNAFYMLHGAPWPQGGYIGDLWKYDLTTKHWSLVYTQPMSPRPAYEPHAYWVPSQNKILIGWSRWWRWFDPATNTVGPLFTSVSDIGLSSGCVSPTGLYQFHNGGVDFLPFTSVGTAGPTNITANYPQFTALGALWTDYICHRWNSYLWDATRQMVIVWSNNRDGTPDGGKRVFALDFVNGKAYEFEQAAGSSYPACEALGTFSKWIHLTGPDCYLGINNRAIDNGWMVFKPGAMTELSATPTWRTGQAIGEFRQITGSALSNTPPTVNPNSKTLPPRMNNWNGYSIDTRSSTVWSPANGGHNDWHGNEVLKLPLSDNAPKWIEVLPSDATVPQPTDAAYYPSGRPCSIHSYQVQQVIERRNRAIRFGATAGATIGNTFRKVDGFNITVAQGVNGWDAQGTYPDIPGTVAVTAGLVTVKNPATEDVYVFVRNSLVYKWTEATNTWAQHNTQVPPKDFLECGAAFDTTRNRIFLIREAATGMRHTYDIATGTWTQQTLTGAAAAAVVGGAKSQGLVYVPALDAYLTRFQAAGGAVYKIDAATFDCTVFATTGGDTIPAGASVGAGNENIYYRWLYVPQYGGVLYLPHYSADAWFLRTN